MKSRAPGLLAALIAALGVLVAARPILAVPDESPHLASEPSEPGLVGDIEGIEPPASKTLQDTTWIADWGFESGGVCTDAGWGKFDNRILNDGSNYWSVGPGIGCLTGSNAGSRSHRKPYRILAVWKCEEHRPHQHS